MLDFEQLCARFTAAGGALDEEQRKGLTQHRLNYRWRDFINSLDESIYILQHSELPGFDFEKVRQEYIARFTLSLVPHGSFLHPLHVPEFAEFRERDLPLRHFPPEASQTQDAHQQALAPHLRAALPPQAKAAQPIAVLAPHLRPPPAPKAQPAQTQAFLAPHMRHRAPPHLRHLTPAARRQLTARAVPPLTQATQPEVAQFPPLPPVNLFPEARQRLQEASARRPQAPARQDFHINTTLGVHPQPLPQAPAEPHLALRFICRPSQPTPFFMGEHITPPLAPNMVCPCQLSGHRCKHKVKKTHRGFWMCGLEEVCTAPGCTNVDGTERCPVKYHARPTCGAIKGTMSCPRDTGKICRFGHDEGGENWRQVLHQFERTVHHPR